MRRPCVLDRRGVVQVMVVARIREIANEEVMRPCPSPVGVMNPAGEGMRGFNLCRPRTTSLIFDVLQVSAILMVAGSWAGKGRRRRVGRMGEKSIG